jgi:epsilon-lactone hydrolase
MRTFPAPVSISPEAKQALAALANSDLKYPPVDDIPAWRRHIAAANEAFGTHFPPQIDGMKYDWEKMAGVAVVRATPTAPLHAPGNIYLEFHGGALVYLGGKPLGPMTNAFAARIGSEVIAVDYRMPPDHPYPAALDDAVAVYRHVTGKYGAANVIVGGLSAGGNIAAALLLRARDAGLPMPAALLLLTPELDLTESGDTFQTLLGMDRMGSHMPANLLYAGGRPLDHPYLSPLFGDVSGFPPTFLQAGTRDLFLSNTVRMHRKLRAAGVDAELHVWEAMMHAGFGGAPEDDEVTAEIRRFLARYQR